MTWKWCVVPMYGYATPFWRYFHVVFDVRVLILICLLIRDRACIRFFGLEVLRKLMSCLIFCPQAPQHLRQCKSTLVGILFHYFDPIGTHGIDWDICISCCCKLGPVYTIPDYFTYRINSHSEVKNKGVYTMPLHSCLSLSPWEQATFFANILKCIKNKK